MKIRIHAALMAFVFAAMMLGVASYAAAQIKVTNGPTIERADSHSATIAWSTNQSSSSRIWYSTDKNNLTEFAEAPYSSGDTHRVELKNLEPGKTYYFQLESQRGNSEAEGAGIMKFQTPANGQPAISNQKAELAKKEAFDSAKVKITSGPEAKNVSTNRALVQWTTNVKGSSRVNYGKDPNNLTELAESPWGQGGLTHTVELKNLQPNTTYYYKVETGQAQGMGGADTESEKVMSFKTTGQGSSSPSANNQKPQKPTVKH